MVENSILKILYINYFFDSIWFRHFYNSFFIDPDVKHARDELKINHLYSRDKTIFGHDFFEFVPDKIIGKEINKMAAVDHFVYSNH